MDCGNVLISYARNDFKSCNCDNGTYVDGGQDDYIRMGGLDPDKAKPVQITLLNEKLPASSD
jgi:hypothetical protein